MTVKIILSNDLNKFIDMRYFYRVIRLSAFAEPGTQTQLDYWQIVDNSASISWDQIYYFETILQKYLKSIYKAEQVNCIWMFWTSALPAELQGIKNAKLRLELKTICIVDNPNASVQPILILKSRPILLIFNLLFFYDFNLFFT